MFVICVAQNYKVFEHDFLHVCGINSWLHADILSNFSKAQKYDYLFIFSKNGIPHAHVHRIFTKKER
jgi:hypothetical protein